MRRNVAKFALPLLALAACNSGDPPAAAPTGPSVTGATARLSDASGRAAGTASVSQAAGGLRVEAEVTGMPPGLHGLHIHMTGRCDPPTFTTAGAHWSPAMRLHGLDNPQGSHAGDMPNINVSADGRGRVTHILPGAVIASLLGDDGTALVVHASEDDQKTDPSGNSGDRIACGAFTAN